MPASTPISHSKTAALARVIDSVPKGYMQYICGTVKPEKAEALARKFHLLYAIGATPAQRITRKKAGLANAILVMYWPENAERVEWLLMATHGTGPIVEQERLKDVCIKPRLIWLGYELLRHTSREKTAWTWRRPKDEMADLYALLTDQLACKQYGAVAETLERISRQPGFHGVRSQSWELFQHVRSRGYQNELPHLFYLQKVSHGERLAL